MIIAKLLNGKRVAINPLNVSYITEDVKRKDVCRIYFLRGSMIDVREIFDLLEAELTAELKA